MMNSEELSQKILQLTQASTDYLTSISNILKVNLHKVEQVDDPFALKSENMELYQSTEFENGSLLSSIEVKLLPKESENRGSLSLSLIEEAEIYVEEIIDTTSLEGVIAQIIPEIDSCLITYPVNGRDVTFYQKIGNNNQLTKITIALI